MIGNFVQSDPRQVALGGRAALALQLEECVANEFEATASLERAKRHVVHAKAALQNYDAQLGAWGIAFNEFGHAE